MSRPEAPGTLNDARISNMILFSKLMMAGSKGEPQYWYRARKGYLSMRRTGGIYDSSSRMFTLRTNSL